MNEEIRLDLLEEDGVFKAINTWLSEYFKTNQIKSILRNFQLELSSPCVIHHVAYWQTSDNTDEPKTIPHVQKWASEDYALKAYQHEVNMSTDIVIAYVRSCLESWGELVSTDEGFHSILPEVARDFRKKKFLNKLHKFADGVRRRDYRNIDNFRIQMSKEIFCLRNSVPSTENEFTASIEKVFSDRMLSDNIELNWKWFVKMLMILTNTVCHLINNVPAEVFHELVGQLIAAVAKGMRKFWNVEDFKWMLATADELETEQPDFYGQHQMTSAEVDVLQKLTPCNSDTFKGVLRQPS